MAKKKNTRKKRRKKRQVEEEERDDIFTLHPETKKGLLTLLFFVLAILFTLSFFDLAGTLGTYLNTFNQNLLGRLSPFLPVFLFFIALSRLMGKSIGVDTVVRFGGGLLIISLSSMVHLLMARPDGVVFGKLLREGGGYLGMTISYLLEQGIGFWGAVVVISAGILASLLLLFKTSLMNIVAPHKALAEFFKKNDGEDDEDEEDEKSESEEEEVIKKPRRSLFASKKVGDNDAKPDEKPSLNPFAPKKTKKYRKISLPLDLLNDKTEKPTAGDVKAHQHIIEKTLENFGIPCEMGNISIGPTVTQFTLKPSDGIKLSKITALSNDLALALAAHPIRIEAPIPGQSLVGIEVPNKAVAIVGLREIIGTKQFQQHPGDLPIALGKDVAGKPWMTDLVKMPHLLIAGATGSGKTVCLNAIILSLLYSNSPDELKLILIDPKRVELPVYNHIPYMLVPAVTETDKTINALKWAIREMDRRFGLLSKFGKRDINSYNASMDEKLPHIVIVVDELADLMVSRSSSEVETAIVRLAQMSRAVGIHLILATQRPSVDVITGLIKANFTARIAFAVASATDSRTILDTSGAEKLVGRGDMLFLSADLSKPKRLQGAFVSDAEIKKVTDFIKDNYGAPDYQDEIVDRSSVGGRGTVFSNNDGDELLPEAKDVIVRAGKGSASLLQRRLKIGYARAARILDILEEQGFIGPADGAKPREILASLEQQQQEKEPEKKSQHHETDEKTEEDEGSDHDEGDEDGGGYDETYGEEDDDEDEKEKEIPWE